MIRILQVSSHSEYLFHDHGHIDQPFETRGSEKGSYPGEDNGFDAVDIPV